MTENETYELSLSLHNADRITTRQVIFGLEPKLLIEFAPGDEEEAIAVDITGSQLGGVEDMITILQGVIRILEHQDVESAVTAATSSETGDQQ